MRNQPSGVAMLSRHLRQVRSNPFLAGSGMTGDAVLFAEVTEALQLRGRQLLPGLSATCAFRGHRGFVVFGIRGRAENRGRGKGAPCQDNQKREGKSEGALSQPYHRTTIDESNQQEREYRDAG